MTLHSYILLAALVDRINQLPGLKIEGSSSELQILENVVIQVTALRNQLRNGKSADELRRRISSKKKAVKLFESTFNLKFPG